MSQPEKVNHPAHYGGGDNPYEVIKVIDAWGLGFSLGDCVKYVARAGKKPTEGELDDLKKGRWYLDHEIEKLEAAQINTALTRAFDNEDFNKRRMALIEKMIELGIENPEELVVPRRG